MSRLQAPTQASYSQYDQRTHVYQVPDMYIGSDEQLPRVDWLFDFNNDTCSQSNITFPAGCERIMLEILSNTADNVVRSRQLGVNPGKITMAMDRKTVVIRNNGVPIPVEIKQGTSMYVPELIFGNMLTSSNYEGERYGIGRNGIGAKACNIYSKYFKVTIGDSIRKLLYTQVWGNNMQARSDPVIEPYNAIESFAEIAYVMDFERFKYTEYPDEAFFLFARHCVDISFTLKLPVIFNSKSYDFSNIKHYAQLYFGDAKTIVHYEWPPGTIVNKGTGVDQQGHKVIPIHEVCVAQTVDNSKTVSFVNSMMTPDGGVHVDEAYKAVSKTLIANINGNKKSKDESKIKINIADVKPHISIILNCHLVNPKFKAQTKSQLASPKPTFIIDDAELKPILKWDNLMNRLYRTLEIKQDSKLKKLDGKKKRYVHLAKGSQANEAGGKNSHLCTLIIVEGKSAMSYPTKVISLIDNGRDFIGTYPMKGKSLNVMNASFEQIMNNNELNDLKQALGLRESLDYRLDENFRTLRYGRLLIMADSDVDGKHIIGLILNLFYCRYRTLLQREFVTYLRTPIIRVFKGLQCTGKFYTKNEYDKWKTVTPNADSYTHKYYKGLGTSRDHEIADDHKNPRTVVCIYDNDHNMGLAMNLAFNEKLADARKEWIRQWKPLFEVEDLIQQPISMFINHELIQYSIEDMRRSIPSLCDGIKTAQRKILWGLFKKWKALRSDKKSKEMKVEGFSGFVADYTAYEHGGGCLDQAIINMTWSFVGSNNLPYFVEDGQFGTRDKGGKDACAARYIYVRPQFWIPLVFRKEDEPLLDIQIGEGKKIEPKFLLPIIPLMLINSCRGIGTAYSTTVPNCHPLAIVDWTKAKIASITNSEIKLPDVKPWYRGFTGVINIVDKRVKDQKQFIDQVMPTMSNTSDTSETTLVTTLVTSETKSDTSDTSETTLVTSDITSQGISNNLTQSDIKQETSKPKAKRYSMITTGDYLYNHLNGVVTVTELPIGIWTDDYRKRLEQQIEDKKITGFRDLSKANTVYFEISGITTSPTYKSLKLIKSYGLSNMTLLDEKGLPCKYDSIQAILEAFFNFRLGYYQKRKDNLIKSKTEYIDKLTEKAKFIYCVVNDEIIVYKRKKDDIKQQMVERKINPDIFSDIKLEACTEDELAKMKAKIEKETAELDGLNKMLPSQLWIDDLTEFETQYKKMYTKE